MSSQMSSPEICWSERNMQQDINLTAVTFRNSTARSFPNEVTSQDTSSCFLLHSPASHTSVFQNGFCNGLCSIWTPKLCGQDFNRAYRLSCFRNLAKNVLQSKGWNMEQKKKKPMTFCGYFSHT